MLSSSVVPQSSNESIELISLKPTPSFFDALSSNDVNDGSSLSSFTTTASATVSGGSSVFNREINPDQRTVDELERDLGDVLSFDVTSINIKDMAKVQSIVMLVGSLLEESHRMPNASERGIEYMLVRRVEDVGLAVAEQLKPTSNGYKTVKLSSGKVDLAVASVNLTQVEELRFPDMLSGDFENNSRQHLNSVILPRAAFVPNATELGQVVWMMFDALTAMKDAANHVIRTRIMNIITRPHRKRKFEKPVRMSFWLSKASLDQMNCVFWNQSNRTKHGVWSTDGCQVVKSNHSAVMCHCNHLTSFAVITRVTKYQPSKEHELPLSIITCVGCGLSILGCLLTIITYAFLPSLRSQRIIIHMNLVTAVLLAQVLFLVAVFGVRPETSQVACYAVAVGLFFFFLCVFSWMLAEGLHIYFMVVRVFDSGRGRKLYYLLIGWGFPLTVTAIVVAIFQTRLLSKEICWLSVETGAIWSFVGPAIFVMTVNLSILIMVMRVTSKMLNEDSPSNVRSLAKAFVTLLPILGLTWVFGLLAVNNSSVVFEYLFAIFNSLQGFLIFLFYCLKNTEVRREFKRKLHNLEAQRRPNTSSTTPRNPPQEIKGVYCDTQQDKIPKELSFDTKL
ncbi:adhesion G protein-coupled receptor L3-like [Oculina patagonica]